MTHGGNEYYWSLVASIMQEDGLGQQQAEHELFIRVVTKHSKQGHMARPIGLKLTLQWGISLPMYYRHLRRIRQTICIP